MKLNNEGLHPQDINEPKYVLFIYTDFETMLSRISKRGDLAYIDKTFTIKENYEMLIAKYKELIGENICVIDNNKTLDFAMGQIKKVLCLNGEVY
jgi:thymidylate kinase